MVLLIHGESQLAPMMLTAGWDVAVEAFEAGPAGAFWLALCCFR